MDDQQKVSSPEEHDDSSEDNTSESETELMVTTRARRTTAGNRYSTLVAQKEVEQDEEDEVAMLFAEGEGEDEDFNSDEGDEDADMSSSDDDDQGPNAAVEDLEGEREIQKEAKAERAKKRKADLALTTVAGLKKKPKIDPTALRRAPAPKPTKRKERVSWLPGSDAAPGRTSLRKQTILLRAETHAKLKENEEQRLKLKAKREKRKRERVAEAPKQMTQADRLAEAERIERRNAKSLNRWEAMEKKRAEEQAARLAALKDRKLEGPVITVHSSLAKYNGEAPPEAKKRGRKPKALLEQLAAAKLAEEQGQARAQSQTQMRAPAQDPNAESTDTTANTANTAAQIVDPNLAIERELTPGNATVQPSTPLSIETDLVSTKKVGGLYQSQSNVEPSKEDGNSFLTGIHEYASMQSENSFQMLDEDATTRDKTTDASPLVDTDKDDALQSVTKEADQGLTRTIDKQVGDKPSHPLEDREGLDLPDPKKELETINSKEKATQVLSQSLSVQDVQPTIDVNMSDHGSHVTQGMEPSTATNESTKPVHQDGNEDSIATHDTEHLQSQPSPTLGEQSQLSVMSIPVEPPVEIISTRNLVILDKFDNLSDETRRNFNVFYKGTKPAKNSQELCAITGLTAKYREPVTGIPYANSTAYKKLQELKNHHFTWSSMLGCYVGRATLVARGVPDGFLGA